MMAVAEQNIINEIIQTSLPKINGAGEYYLSVNSDNIFDGFREVRNLSEFPALCVVEIPQTSFTPQDSAGKNYVSGGSATNVRDGWNIDVIGYHKSKTGADLPALLRQFSNDIIEAMLDDKTRGGHAWATTLTTVVRDVRFDKNIGAVVCSFSIKYQR